jgi:tetratricopeptide (TPR) repeat protein
MVKAGAELKRSLDLAPENRAAAVSYSDYLWECNRKDDAIRVLASYVERRPDDKPAHFDLGTRMILSGTDPAGAKVVFEDCLALQSDTGMPSETMVRWCLGLACHLLGEEEQAQREWSTVYEMDEDFDHILEKSPQMSELNPLKGK